MRQSPQETFALIAALEEEERKNMKYLSEDDYHQIQKDLHHRME